MQESRHAWVICSSNKSRAAKKLHIYFNFISFEGIFIEHLPPGAGLGEAGLCVNMKGMIPLRNEIVLENDLSGLGARNETTLGIYGGTDLMLETRSLQHPGE